MTPPPLFPFPILQGTKGELARAFGDLVKCMWEGKENCVYPRDFRDVLCDHAQQFLGYEQHDRWERIFCGDVHRNRTVSVTRNGPIHTASSSSGDKFTPHTLHEQTRARFSRSLMSESSYFACSRLLSLFGSRTERICGSDAEGVHPKKCHYFLNRLPSMDAHEIANPIRLLYEFVRPLRGQYPLSRLTPS